MMASNPFCLASFSPTCFSAPAAAAAAAGLSVSVRMSKWSLSRLIIWKWARFCLSFTHCCSKTTIIQGPSWRGGWDSPNFDSVTADKLCFTLSRAKFPWYHCQQNQVSIIAFLFLNLVRSSRSQEGLAVAAAVATSSAGDIIALRKDEGWVQQEDGMLIFVYKAISRSSLLRTTSSLPSSSIQHSVECHLCSALATPITPAFCDKPIGFRLSIYVYTCQTTLRTVLLAAFGAFDFGKRPPTNRVA